MSRFVDLSGQRFGRLVVIERIPSVNYPPAKAGGLVTAP